MTTQLLSQCNVCEHFRPPFGGGKETCAAFPDGIPAKVLDNEVDHRKAVDGDHGITWKAHNGAAFPVESFGSKSAPRRMRRKHTPGGHPHNQQSHAGHDSPSIPGLLEDHDLFHDEEYWDEFGDEMYSETTESGLSPRFFENSNAHLAYDLKDSNFQVLGNLEDSEGIRSLAAVVRDVLDLDMDSYGDEDEDDDELVYRASDSGSGLEFGRYQSGDVFIRTEDGGRIDISEREAEDLADKLESVAEVWDREFEYSEAKSLRRKHLSDAKTRRAMNTKTMQANGFRIKNADRGEFSAVLATLNVIDSDGDVTRPGAFDSSDFPLSAYGHKSWEGALPVGIGRVKEVGNEAILEGHFFMDTTHGRDTFLTVKRLGPLGQWSYGYDPVGHSNGMHEGKSVRFLEKLKVHEASPVLVGAGVGTRTLGTKGRSMTSSGRSRAVKGAIPCHETKTVSRAWDRVRTENALPDDARPSDLRTVFAYVDPDGDPELKASYSWPHHHGIGGPANLRACLMGIAALNGPAGADMGEPERKGIYDHLAGHLKDADRDIPDLRTGSGDNSKSRFSDEAVMVLASVSGLIDRASDVMAMRRTKGKGMAAGTADLLGWVSDEIVRLKHLLSNPVEPEIPQPDDDEVASVIAASIARLNGI